MLSFYKLCCLMESTPSKFASPYRFALRVKQLLEELTHRECVMVALFCAKLEKPMTKESKKCIQLAEKWLNGQKVLMKKINAAANAVTIYAKSPFYLCRTLTGMAVGVYTSAAVVSLVRRDPSLEQPIMNYIQNILTNKQKLKQNIQNTLIPKGFCINQNWDEFEIRQILDYLEEHNYSLFTDLGKNKLRFELFHIEGTYEELIKAIHTKYLTQFKNWCCPGESTDAPQ